MAFPSGIRTGHDYGRSLKGIPMMTRLELLVLVSEGLTDELEHGLTA